MTDAAATDLWPASGYRLLDVDDAGHLRVTDDFLRAFLMRPELHPVEESCAAERALHAQLMETPAFKPGERDLSAMADGDVIGNYRVFLSFRDYLLDCGTVEGAYLRLFQGRATISIPPLFIDQLVHVIARHVLAGRNDPFQARAAELLFRSQKVTVSDGRILAADEEVVEMHRATGGFGNIGRLLADAAVPMREVELDVMTPENAGGYVARSDNFDMVLDLSFGDPGLDAFCRVVEGWVGHLLGIDVSVQPAQQIRDNRWRWHVGLDSEASGLLDDLYRGATVPDDRLARLISLFRLEFDDRAAAADEMAGRPVYLGLAMDETSVLRMKPQNLLVNLPLRRAA